MLRRLKLGKVSEPGGEIEPTGRVAGWWSDMLSMALGPDEPLKLRIYKSTGSLRWPRCTMWYVGGDE